MSDCFFCGSFVGEETHDGGCKGRTIGNRDICEQCLSELKYMLENVTAKSPSLREKKAPEDADDFEETNEENVPIDQQVEEELREDDDDPFRASPKE